MFQKLYCFYISIKVPNYPLFKILDNIEAATPKFEKIMQKSKIEECKNIEDFALKFFTKEEV